MHTNLTRKLVPLAAAAVCAVAGFSACSYNASKPDILLHVDGVQVSAVRGVVTITDTNNDPAQQYFPRFGSGNGAALDLSFAAPSAGTYTLTIHVEAFDADDNRVGDGTVSSGGPVTLPANPPVALTMALGSVNTDGTFGARCAVASADAGGAQSCTGGLTCVFYQGVGSRGVCTQVCTGVCPATPTPAATCLPYTGTTNACQWECDQADGGTSACPPGLVCASQTGSTKKFCQPLP